MSKACALIAAVLLGAIAAVWLSLTTRPAQSAGDQWDLYGAPSPAPMLREARRAPKFFIHRKRKKPAARTRLAKHRELRRGAVESAAAQPGGRPLPPDGGRAPDAFAAVPVTWPAPAFASGAIALRQAPARAVDTQRRIRREQPFRETTIGKVAIVAAFFGCVACGAFTKEIRTAFGDLRGERT